MREALVLTRNAAGAVREREACRRFLERVVDDSLEGLLVDGRQVEPFDVWRVCQHQPWWRRWLARIWRR